MLFFKFVMQFRITEFIIIVPVATDILVEGFECTNKVAGEFAPCVVLHMLMATL
jgi:hypothetical protein